MTTVYHLSDWHQRADGFRQMLDFEIRSQQLAEPDLIVITGDMIHNYSPFKRRIADQGQYEGKRQTEQYHTLIDYIDQVWPGVDIFAIRGNHDWCNYEIPGSVKAFDSLEGQTYEWKGLKIHGFRGVPTFHGNWNDEYSERALDIVASYTPEDTDILITHVPPEGVLDDAHDARCYICGNARDRQGNCGQIHVYDPSDPNYKMPVIVPNNIGSTSVRNLVNRLPKLKAHFFGHVHECGGRVEVRGNAVFSNASCTLNKVVL